MGNVRVEINGMALGTRPYVRLVNPQCGIIRDATHAEVSI